MTHRTRKADPTEALATQVATQCTAVRLRLINRVVTSIYDRELRPVGLTICQLGILVVLLRRGRARPTEVCDLLQLDASTLSRNIERMNAAGWVRPVPADDGRSHWLTPTAKGRRLFTKALPYWQRAQRQTVSLLGDTGVEAISAVAEGIWSGADGDG